MGSAPIPAMRLLCGSAKKRARKLKAVAAPLSMWLAASCHPHNQRLCCFLPRPHPVPHPPLPPPLSSLPRSCIPPPPFTVGLQDRIPHGHLCAEITVSTQAPDALPQTAQRAGELRGGGYRRGGRRKHK